MDYQKYLESLPKEVATLQATLSLAFAFGLVRMFELGFISDDQAAQVLYLTQSGKVQIQIELGPDLQVEE